jgi:hypothetical protein
MRDGALARFGGRRWQEEVELGLHFLEGDVVTCIQGLVGEDYCGSHIHEASLQELIVFKLRPARALDFWVDNIISDLIHTRDHRGL